MEQLAQAIDQHRQYLQQSGEWQLRETNRLQAELEAIIHASLVKRWRTSLPESSYQEAVAGLLNRCISPQQAADRLLQGELR